MLSFNRRHVLAAAAAATLVPGYALAQAPYPSKPIKIIVPLPAGGAADAGARIVADALQRQLKQPVLVDNRPGGSYVLGMQAISSAPADGYTLINLNLGMVAAQVTMKRFDLEKSVTPIASIGTTPNLFVVSAKSKFGSIHELISYAKANPKKLNYGTVGLGTLEHLWTTTFSQKQGIEATHVPFKGLPDALTALIQGEIDFIPAVYPAAFPYVQKGLLRSFGVISDKRVPIMADIPTLKEQGIDTPAMEFWTGFGAPVGTPAPVIERLRQALSIAMRDPGFKEKFVALGTTVSTTPAEADLQKIIAHDLVWMANTAKSANIRLD